MNSESIKKHQSGTNQRSGVALIMVLGLLAVLTILCVAFAISMRVERLAARAFANNTRAEQLMSIAFVRSMESVNHLMRDRDPGDGTIDPLLYPDFGAISPSRDAIASKGVTTHNVPDLRTGEALDFIPESLQTEVNQVYAGGANDPEWITDGIPGGRIAYVLVNASGLLDANLAGSTNIREFSEHIGELDLSGLPDISSEATFISDREEHVRYESTPEIRQLNDGVNVVSNFFWYSYDANRDQVFSDPRGPAGVDLRRPPPGLGLRSVVLTNKFDLNAITNYAGYWTPGNYNGYRGDPLFMAQFFSPLTNLLAQAGIERADDVGWNLVNYLDPDRVPQGGAVPNYPWRHTEGGEAIPLVNEIVLFPVLGNPSNYQFAVELWYPFVPINVSAADDFYLQVSVFTNANLAALHANDELAIQSAQFAPWSFTTNIANMTYGTATEFIVARGPEMRINFADPNMALRMLARVMKRDGSYVNPVDEAPGYQRGEVTTGGAGGSPATRDHYRRTLFAWPGPQGLSVNDPRVNGQIKYWTSAGNYSGGTWKNIGGTNYSHTAHTLGATNVNCRPWGVGRQGTPIYAKNGIMRNIGELGHIFRSNLDDEIPANPFWRTIELMRKGEGALLLDTIDVHDGEEPSFGLVSINTRQRGVLGALFNNLEIGNAAIPGAGAYLIPEADINNLISEIIDYASYRDRQYMSFADLFTDEPDGGRLAVAFRKCAPADDASNDIYKEDTFRHISELITFRQNIFMVIAIAQALAPDNETVLAEKRAVATIYRDAYTGRHFTRSFKWLND